LAEDVIGSDGCAAVFVAMLWRGGCRENKMQPKCAVALAEGAVTVRDAEDFP
jgi:hypothetical protein